MLVSGRVYLTKAALSYIFVGIYVFNIYIYINVTHYKGGSVTIFVGIYININPKDPNPLDIELGTLCVFPRRQQVVLQKAYESYQRVPWLSNEDENFKVSHNQPEQ